VEKEKVSYGSEKTMSLNITTAVEETQAATLLTMNSPLQA